MKKIAFILVFALIFSTLGISVAAQASIPVIAEVFDTADDDLRIVVYVKDVKKLTSLRTVIEYDTSVYNLKSAKASTYTDSFGDETENISGMWVFGNLADNSGCVGAFITYGGVTKLAKTAACEFIIESKNGSFDLSEITVSVSELITDDNNEENDIYVKTRICFTEPTVDISGVFGYEIKEATVNITEFKTEDEVVFVPEYIDGLTVRSVKCESVCENPFVVFERNVLSVGNKVFTDKNTVVAPFGSAPVAAVKKAGGKYLGYYEKVKPDLNENVLYTDQYLVDDINQLFSCTADFNLQPSHKILTDYFGTGTIISLKNGDNTADFTLCVKGDVNGDSVCDVLDSVLTEKFINNTVDLKQVEEKSTDFDGDNKVDVQDYTQLVNVALGSEYKIFDGVRGDFNGDYAVDVLDILIFNKKISDNKLSVEEKAKMDFNNDGVLDSDDGDILNEMVMMFE